jgi:hypothetical protein
MNISLENVIKIIVHIPKTLFIVDKYPGDKPICLLLELRRQLIYEGSD